MAVFSEKNVIIKNITPIPRYVRMTAVFMQCSMAKEQKENYETAVVVICLVFTPRESTEVGFLQLLLSNTLYSQLNSHERQSTNYIHKL